MTIVYLVYAYLMAGLFLAIWFCFFQAGKTDPGAAHTGIGFKLIIMPAAILLWPLLLRKPKNKEYDHSSS